MASPIVELLRDLATALGRLDVRWYLFGAQAALVHGAARLTADVDVTVELGEETVDGLLQALAAEQFAPRLDDDLDGFIRRTRVVPLVHASSQVPLDVVLAGTSLEASFAARAECHELEGVEIMVASAEDLIAMKVLSGRPKDHDDVIAIISAKAELDRGAIRQILEMLESALDRSDLSRDWEALVDRADKR